MYNSLQMFTKRSKTSGLNFAYYLLPYYQARSIFIVMLSAVDLLKWLFKGHSLGAMTHGFEDMSSAIAREPRMLPLCILQVRFQLMFTFEFRII